LLLLLLLLLSTASEGKPISKFEIFNYTTMWNVLLLILSATLYYAYARTDAEHLDPMHYPMCTDKKIGDYAFFSSCSLLLRNIVVGGWFDVDSILFLSEQ
jgi:hypothetical protein